ncbi:MAG: transcriptional repressor [Candidatus Omnitrophica bacterium]|nr:transcriptional repressor [Candidatus Omnitrophota bacterium]
MKKEEMVKILVDKEIPVSYHRLKILGFLMDNRIHPSVDDIYKKLLSEIPTLSKTTVYNTLKTFVDKGIISMVTTEEDEIRYDYLEEQHLHFKCKKCGTLYDIFHKCEILKQSEIDGHMIDEHHLYFRGICRKCRKEKGGKE